MRTALPLVVLILLAGCDAAASKPKRPASTSKPKPPASLPMPSRPEPAAPVWRVVSVHDGDTLRAIDAGKVEQRFQMTGDRGMATGLGQSSLGRVQLRSG